MNAVRTLIVGIGSSHGDDRAGWLVAERLATLDDRDGVSVRQARSPLDLLAWVEGVEQLLLCDACQGLGPVGQWRRWDWPTKEIATVRWSGTHDFPLPAALELAERLGRLPQRLCLWSVEGAGGHELSPLSPAVEAAIPLIAQDIAQTVANAGIEELDPCTNNRW